MLLYCLILNVLLQMVRLRCSFQVLTLIELLPRAYQLTGTPNTDSAYRLCRRKVWL